ncbi:transcriptional regulator HilA [Variibacter gotjawalensis]|uniref:Transcriptional regulator HilA n=1 Tax=Variibacter gotjawalensis TaxID=1333996 RepID=A0A0S3PTX1_9BRAD|nr:tetratricopeptide repeat protein [Variibacter gotjawalensis]NIK49708.1 TolB-like protein/Tfp pilus assembly protein PilF [Variibacter gotjawalensis]RZS45718.1 TolB-like protein [Variibacter gotjawalensis]BAT59391.1 transcriptional regulator HilA [Variibacter gotjawalensis]
MRQEWQTASARALRAAYRALTVALNFHRIGYARLAARVAKVRWEAIQLRYLVEDFVLDTERRELRRGANLIAVPPQVFDLLAYLIRHRERVVTKDDLIAAIWDGRAVSESALTTRINAARVVLGDSGDSQRLIKTLLRKGVRFVGEVTEQSSNTQTQPSVEPPVGTPAPTEKPSIAILPFNNMSGDPEQSYFADGMAEDITIALSKVWWLSVAARNSTFAYKGKAVDVREIGRELGARYVLEGSVRKASNQVRITAQLLDSTTGHSVWAERYDRELADTFAVQDEITEQVVAAIGPQLYAAEGLRAKRKAPESFDAWECVIRALALLNSRARADIQAARVLLDKAVQVDPGYAKAHSLLAFAATLGVHMGWDKIGDAVEAASAAAQRALQLDADDPWSHLAVGYVLAWSRRPTEAVPKYEKALALDPNFATAHWLLGLSLNYLGRADEAFAHADKAAGLSAHDLFARGNAGVANNLRSMSCFIRGRYREGSDYARLAITESPNLSAAWRPLVVNCALDGELEEAAKVLGLLKQKFLPHLTLKWIDDELPYVRDDDRRRYLEGFRLAGLE